MVGSPMRLKKNKNVQDHNHWVKQSCPNGWLGYMPEQKHITRLNRVVALFHKFSKKNIFYQVRICLLFKGC
jgi:hypothetical protein